MIAKMISGRQNRNLSVRRFSGDDASRTDDNYKPVTLQFSE